MPGDYLKFRSDDPTFKRWAHCFKSLEGAKKLPDLEEGQHRVLIRGLAHDAGVAVNGGRVGAALAPKSFREAFYKMVATVNDLEIWDQGDFVNNTLSADAAHDWVRKNQAEGEFSLKVSLGGGHDWAAVDFDVSSDNSSMQVIHIDSHLDVRPYTKIHSGMPFRYLAEKDTKIWCFGVQEELNSPQQWDYGQMKFQGFYSLDDIENNFSKAMDHCATDIHAQSPLGLSIDLDAFAQGVSPGVSAPSARGVSLEYVVQIIDAVAKNLTHVGFYELNPTYDRDGQSARLAAYLLSRILLKARV